MQILVMGDFDMSLQALVERSKSFVADMVDGLYYYIIHCLSPFAYPSLVLVYTSRTTGQFPSVPLLILKSHKSRTYDSSFSYKKYIFQFI